MFAIVRLGHEIPRAVEALDAFGRELRPALIRVQRRHRRRYAARNDPALTASARPRRYDSSQRELGSTMNLGAPEILVILVVALLVFGPHKLPEIGRQVGGAMRELRKMQDSVKQRAPDGDERGRSRATTSRSSAALPTTPEAPVSTTPEIEAAASMVEEPDHTDQPVPPPPPRARQGLRGPLRLVQLAGRRTRWRTKDGNADGQMTLDRASGRAAPPHLRLRDRGRRRRRRSCSSSSRRS